ncbi:NAD(P)/FAD-dependent oxidoreductase [Pseudoneobacillus sp. C159]
MGKQKNIIIVGGGYAGIHLLTGLKKQLKDQINENIKIIFIDKNAYHFKKVKLFKAITEETTDQLRIPLTRFCGPGIDFIQGSLDNVNPINKTIILKTNTEGNIELPYHQLILTIGSIPRKVHPELGGKSLCSLDSAKEIRQDLLTMIRDSSEHLKIAVIGGGVTGIETATEINSWLNLYSPKKIEVFLINEKNRLLDDLPEKVSLQLENRLNNQGISIINGKKVTTFQSTQIQFTEGSPLQANYCIWTVGQIPHPTVKKLALPLSNDGRLLTDSQYRLFDYPTIYAIGDCAHVLDPNTGDLAGMTCKEAISQAQKLTKIIKANLEGIAAPSHQNYPDLLCISLGSKDGFVWSRKWGIDFILTGKLGSKIREYTWDIASLNN